MIDPRTWSAETWAAIAAIASAVAAVSSVRWQKRSALQSASPELVLEEFSTANEGGTRYIRAGRVRNVGAGVANAIYGTVPREGAGYSLPVGGGQLVAMLNTGMDAPLQFEIMMQEPVPSDGFTVGSVTAVLYCWDIHGWRHEFSYSFFVSPHDIGMTHPVAPGLMISSRFHSRLSPLRQSLERHVPTFMRALPKGR